MTEMEEKVAAAIDGVALFSRFNDWTSDHVPGLPIEICRHGEGDEEEIVVVQRFPAHVGEGAALTQLLRIHRARAAIEAMREPTEEMLGRPAIEAFITARAPEIKRYRDEAREKLKSDPSAAIFAEGVANGLGSGSVKDLTAVFTAMIDAALSPEKTGA